MVIFLPFLSSLFQLVVVSKSQNYFLYIQTNSVSL